jgi:NTP pyrophosphatase (non-canonical NTP hydrolase)
MILEKFSKTNLERCEKGFGHTLSSWSLSDWMTATLGELGEAANIVKKLNRVRDGIKGNKQEFDDLRAQLSRELADVFIYLDLMVQAAGFQLSEIVPRVFNAKSMEIDCPISFGTADA